MTPDLITKQDCERTQDIFMKEIRDIKSSIEDIQINVAKLPGCLTKKLDEKYVSKEAFKPIQKIVYGFVGAILLGVLVAILALIIK